MKNLANLDPYEYWKIIWRRRWYVLTGFALVSIGTVIYSWRTPNVYRSQSLIMVEETIIPQDYARSSDRSSPEEQIAAIRQAVQSRSFAERLIQEFQLLGYGSDRKFSMDEAIGALAKNIQVVGTSKNTFEISTVSTEPQLAQTIVRRVVDTLIQSSNSSRKTKAVEADQFVDEQMRQTQQKLLDQEEKIKQFKMAHMGGLPEQSVSNMNALSALNAQLAVTENALQQTRDQQKQLDLQAREQMKTTALSVSILEQPVQSGSANLDTGGTNVTNPLLEAKQKELKALSLKYTPLHPDVVRLTREVEELKRQAEASSSPELNSIEKVGEPPASAFNEDPTFGLGSIGSLVEAENKIRAETIKNSLAKREKERNDLLAQIKIFQSRLNLGPALEQEFSGLSREYESIKQQYASLQNKKFQAELTTSLETSKNSATYRIVDEANLPEKPSFPNRMQIILLGLCGGIVLGIGAAFGRELLDSTVLSEDEVAAVLKLPVLGSVLEIPRKEQMMLMQISKMAKRA
jgi:polysaccharide chain length determinant protein (PEP-CTERM system associated)